MTGRRVAITGMGVVSALGCSLRDYESELRRCRTGIQPCARPAVPFATSPDTPSTWMAAAVTAPDVQLHDKAIGLDPFAHFALCAAKEAVTDAGLQSLLNFQEKTAIIIGTVYGGDDSREEASRRTSIQGGRPHPLTIVREMLNAATTAISIEFGITGPSLTVSTACASGAHAIGEAYHMIKFGVAERAVCGGSDTLPSHTQFSCWQQMRVLSDVPCQPFAATRKGISLGEGSGILVLEEMESARARGATIYAELAGFGMGADAADWVNPSPKGMLRCMQEALHDAEITPAELAYINAHATGTLRGDAAEAEALQKLLEGNRVPVSSTKALHGHAMGASGALEAIATVLALRGEWLPGMPVTTTDPEMNLHFVWQEANEPGAMRGVAALSNSFGFGGLNAALVFRRAESDSRKAMQ